LICQEAHRLIHPYLDGELDLVRSLEIEAHLNDCQTCAQAYHELRSLHSAVSDTAREFDLHFQLRPINGQSGALFLDTDGRL